MSLLKQTIRTAAAAALVCVPAMPAAASPLLLFGPLALSRHVLGAAVRLATLPLAVASAAISESGAPSYQQAPGYYARSDYPQQPEYYAQQPEYYAQQPEYYAQQPEYYARPGYYPSAPAYYARPGYFQSAPAYYARSPASYPRTSGYYARPPSYYSGVRPYYARPSAYSPAPYSRTPSYVPRALYRPPANDAHPFPRYSVTSSRGYYAPHPRYTAANNFHIHTESGGFAHRRY